MDLARIALSTLASLPSELIFVFDKSGQCVAVFGDPSAELIAQFGDFRLWVGKNCVDLMGETGKRLLGVIESVLGGEEASFVRRGVVSLPEGRLSFDAKVWKVEGLPFVACQALRLGTLSDQLSDSRSRLEAVETQSAQFVCEIDSSGTLTYAGGKCREFGLSPEELVGLRLPNVAPRFAIGRPGEVEIMRGAIERFLATQQPLESYRITAVDRSGRLRSLVSSGDWYTTASGERRGILLFRDANAPDTAAPADRARALSSLAGSLVDAVVEVSPEGVILAATPLPPRWSGSGEALEGRSVFDFIHPDDVERAAAALATPTQPPDLEPSIFRWRAAAGGWRSVETRAVVYTLETGEAKFIAVGRDVTDEIEPAEDAEAELTPSPSSLQERNLAVLAGGVAHDFNNVLTVSLGVTDLIAEQLPPDSPVRGYLAEVVTASRHAADLARQLLAISGQPRHSFAPCDLNVVVGGVAGLLRSALPKSVRFEFTPCEGALWVEGDVAQIRQVLLNLVTNAGEAIGVRPGSVTIATRRARLASESGELADFAVIEVQDDGPGMDEATRTRAFEPTFTTKATGHGLGLAVVRSVIGRHRGRISVDARPQGGTRFRIELPALPADAAAAELRLRERLFAPPCAEGGSVLIVDDDDAVRRMSAAMLGVAHFTVLEAADAASARAIVASPTPLDCAVVDLVMPDADGLMLIEELRAARPELRFVVCSGAVDRLPSPSAGLVVLEKPFRYAELIEAVWRCIDGSD